MDRVDESLSSGNSMTDAIRMGSSLLLECELFYLSLFESSSTYLQSFSFNSELYQTPMSPCSSLWTLKVLYSLFEVFIFKPLAMAFYWEKDCFKTRLKWATSFWGHSTYCKLLLSPMKIVRIPISQEYHSKNPCKSSGFSSCSTKASNCFISNGSFVLIKHCIFTSALTPVFVSAMNLPCTYLWILTLGLIVNGLVEGFEYIAIEFLAWLSMNKVSFWEFKFITLNWFFDVLRRQVTINGDFDKKGVLPGFNFH